ncbi:BglII/BstYI family type II restriction endonuclease [Xanthomonas campestris pv. raphani]|uniref:BglII/BstYI family type II restriction endonuclease n=1 Tax=Xanthomonas campestris TaxID=339 RepID=UPI002B2276F4|nr:BglII/BstYI family type II restriction endonuclease [Xanthomonas campestris]MEA9913494.1 BglII/BstYI family type II restriction endonuclease [Xanthomonas campestris pv. raphani]
MRIECTDYNNAAQVIAGSYGSQWTELERVLHAMPLHLKASDQARIQGRAIFDPVGTNQHIADELVPLGWQQNIVIPQDFKFLGTDVDFGKNGAVIEVQFSNYPFLLNNTLRSELFFRAQSVFHGAPTGLVIIVTKAGMFPSSNSTLYYEQAQKQLNALAQHGVFTVPIRLVGLFEDVGRVRANWTGYSAARYSRTVGSRELRPFVIANGRAGRCKIDPEETLGGL